MVIEQGWVWGGTGDVDVDGVPAWGGGPVRGRSQTSVGLFGSEASQGQSEEMCQIQ